MLRAVSLIAIFASIAACSGAAPAPSGEAEAPAPSPSAGTAHGAAPYVVAVFDVELTSAGAPTAVRVEVTRSGAPVRRAVVVAGAPGEKVTLDEKSPGTYGGTLSGAHPAYTLSVETPEGGLDDVTLVAPAQQEAYLDGDTALAWAPSGEGDVDDVRVTLTPSGHDDDDDAYDVHTGDVGKVTLPAGPMRDERTRIRLERSVSARLGAQGIGFVHMTTMASVGSLAKR